MRKIAAPHIIIPLVVFAMAKLLAYFIAIQGNCWSVFGFDCWGRWDSALYLDVAQNGHNLFYCGPDQGYQTVSTTDWCGNAGWAPLYPMLMRLLSDLSDYSLQQAGLFLSNFFFLAFLFAGARLLDIKAFAWRNWALLGIMAFCPGNIYFHAVFPLSQVAFLLTLFFLFLKNQKLMAAGIAGFFAVISYSIGFFLIGALGLYGLAFLLQKNARLWQFVLKTCAPVFLGLLTLFVYDHFATGHWNALFLIQGKYGHSLHSPLKLAGQHWQRLSETPFSLKSWIEIQNLVMVVYVLLMTAVILFKRTDGPFRFFHASYLFLFWFLPFSASLDVGLYRNAAVLAPAHSALKIMPSWLINAVLIVFLLLSYPMGVLFIQSVLV